MAGEIRIAKSGNIPGNYKDRFLKLIPSEIVTAYVTILGLIHSSSQASNGILLWLTFSVLFTLTPFYLYVISGIRKIATIIFTTVAFVIWVIVVGGGPFDELGVDPCNMSLFGSISLILYSLFVPFFYRG